jgi:hypothetical protein
MSLVLVDISFLESDQVDEVAKVSVSAALRLDDDAMTIMMMILIVILHLLAAVVAEPSEPQL